MKKFFKNNAKLFVLAIATISMGFLVFTSKDFNLISKGTKVSTAETKEGYNFNYIDGAVYEEYYTNYDEYFDNYDEYNENYNYNYNYNSNSMYEYVESEVDVPSVKYSRSKFINLFEDFDPYEFIETSGKVTVLYNNVDNTKIGSYTIAYSVCSYSSSARCRYVSIDVIVRDLNDKYQEYEEYNSYKKLASAKWEKVSTKKCTIGSKSCLPNNVDMPVATDPYDGNELRVKITSNNVNINEPGYYYITYSTTTNNGITSSIVKQIQITDNNNLYQSNSYNGNIKTKNIENYEWKNVVTSSYKCVNPYKSGAEAWEFVAKLNNDDHATYYYNQNGYTGILKKVSFYEVNPYQGVDIREQLGQCTYAGQVKTLSRTWIGVYSGTVTNYGY